MFPGDSGGGHKSTGGTGGTSKEGQQETPSAGGDKHDHSHAPDKQGSGSGSGGSGRPGDTGKQSGGDPRK